MNPHALNVLVMVAAFLGPVVAVVLSRWQHAKAQDERERSQEIRLIQLQSAINAIPEKMNGKIIRAIIEHMERCPWSRRENTNPEVGF